MGRSPRCSKEELNRGYWTAMEDKTLANYIKARGEGEWRSLPERAGLKRCGKSCRLRWLNYLRPSIKRGNISDDEEELIIRLHNLLGNRWSLIARRLPGRTDNEIKNYWNTTLAKKAPPPNKLRRKTSTVTSAAAVTQPQVIRPKATRPARFPVPSGPLLVADDETIPLKLQLQVDQAHLVNSHHAGNASNTQVHCGLTCSTEEVNGTSAVNYCGSNYFHATHGHDALLSDYWTGNDDFDLETFVAHWI